MERSVPLLLEFSLELSEPLILTFSAGGATGLDLPHVVLGYSVEVQGLGYVVWSHCCRGRFGKLGVRFTLKRDILRLTTVNILLVGEDEQDNIAHFAVLDNAAEFGLGFFHARAVAGVDDEDEGVGSWRRREKMLVSCGLDSHAHSLAVLRCGPPSFAFPPSSCMDILLTREVVSPKRSDLVLSADVPDVEARVLVRDGLDVEADGRDGVDFAGGARRELEGVEDGFREVRLLAGVLFLSAPLDLACKEAV
jgi:hypothetical protein